MLSRFRFILTITSIAAAFVFGGVALAQENKPALPTGKEIVDRSIEVTGGREAYAKLNNRMTKASVEVAGVGLKGTVVSYQAKPNLTYTKIDLANIATVEQGADGTIAWENNSMTGPRLLEGQELTTTLLLSRFDDSEVEDLFDTVICVGEEDVAGEACYKVVMTAEGISPVSTYFSKATGYTVKTEMELETPAGLAKIENFSADFRDVDGIKVPFKNSQKALGQEMVIMLEEVKHNVEIPADRFAIPAEVKALLPEKPEN